MTPLARHSTIGLVRPPDKTFALDSGFRNRKTRTGAGPCRSIGVHGIPGIDPRGCPGRHLSGFRNTKFAVSQSDRWHIPYAFLFRWGTMIWLQSAGEFEVSGLLAMKPFAFVVERESEGRIKGLLYSKSGCVLQFSRRFYGRFRRYPGVAKEISVVISSSTLPTSNPAMKQPIV